jgi:hypothetical protein
MSLTYIDDDDLQILDVDAPTIACIEFQCGCEAIVFLRDERKILIPDLTPEEWLDLTESDDAGTIVRELIRSHRGRFVR